MPTDSEEEKSVPKKKFPVLIVSNQEVFCQDMKQIFLEVNSMQSSHYPFSPDLFESGYEIEFEVSYAVTLQEIAKKTSGTELPYEIVIINHTESVTKRLLEVLRQVAPDCESKVACYDYSQVASGVDETALIVEYMRLGAWDCVLRDPSTKVKHFEGFVLSKALRGLEAKYKRFQRERSLEQLHQYIDADEQYDLRLKHVGEVVAFKSTGPGLNDWEVIASGPNRSFFDEQFFLYTMLESSDKEEQDIFYLKIEVVGEEQ